MYQFFVPPENIQGNRVVITGEDVNHIKNVLRMKVGEEIAVSNGEDGKEYRCGIVELGCYTECVDKERCSCHITNRFKSK